MNSIGLALPVHDACGKAAGHTRYAADMTLPGMAYACILHSTIPHGIVREIHAEEALSSEHVLGVFHCFNTTDKKYNRYRSNYDQTNLPPEERVFQDHVRFIGDRVAAVVAEDPDTARCACRNIKVVYDELPFTTGFDDTLAGRNMSEGISPVRDEYVFELGKAPEGTDLIPVETETEIPRLHHAAMEPHACIADYDPFEQCLTVYSANQAVHGIRTVLSDLLDLPQSRIRVVKTTMGGSFGCKQEWFLEPVAALLAKELQRPVKLVYTREEVMASSVVRGAMRSSIRSLFSRDGKIRSLEMDLVMDAGAYVSSAGDYIRAFGGKLFRCYHMEHVCFRARVISSNTPVSGAFRGWSAPEEAIMLEQHMDMAADLLGMDRIALRLVNAELPGSIDVKSGVPLEDIRIRDALLLGMKSFRWEERRSQNDAFNAAQKRCRRGIGIGCGGHGNTYFPRFPDYGECRLQLNSDGSVQAQISLHDHGCGSVTAIRMILSEVLSLPQDQIQLSEADTAVTPLDFGCFASRTVYVLGAAAEQAARKLLSILLENAAELSGLPAESLYPDNGFIHSHTAETCRLSFGELARHHMKTRANNLAVQIQVPVTSNPGVTGVHFAEVEVDTWTGQTKVLDYLAVHDIGQPINSGMCIAQIQGAAQMGCGAALSEELSVDTGGRTSASLSRYHLQLAPDLPEIRVELLTDGKSAHGPFGAKSIGEVSYVPAAAAVCGAVNDALRAHLGTLPFTPDRILTYLAEKETSQ